jgi:hypothetical protein
MLEHFHADSTPAAFLPSFNQDIFNCQILKHLHRSGQCSGAFDFSRIAAATPLVRPIFSDCSVCIPATSTIPMELLPLIFLRALADASRIHFQSGNFRESKQRTRYQ